MKIITLTLALLWPATVLAEPQQRQAFRDANGRVTGWATSNGSGGTTFYDASARNTGRSVTNGNTTITYDAMGRQVGTVTSKPKGTPQ